MVESLSEAQLKSVTSLATALEIEGSSQTGATLRQLLMEVEHLRAYPAALERTERGVTKPFRLGSLGALLCDLLGTRYVEKSADPRMMQRILRDVADIYRGLAAASSLIEKEAQYFPSLPPLSSEESEKILEEGRKSVS